MKKAVSSAELTLETVITENHRCSQEVRAFFKSVIPKFHFSTYIQNYFKENVGKTYRDAVDTWVEEEKRKKEPTYKKRSLLNLNTINSYVITLQIRVIKGKTVKQPLKLGMR